MAEDELTAYSASSQGISQAFTLTLYLEIMEGWPDLAYGISGV
jgi:hypothetical protein